MIEFTGGENIAIKVPAASYHATINFYQSILKLGVAGRQPSSHAFNFGSGNSHTILWVDRESNCERAEVRLEIRVSNIEHAERVLAEMGIERRDDIEQLPPAFRGFWIVSPCGIVHLVSEVGQ